MSHIDWQCDIIIYQAMLNACNGVLQPNVCAKGYSVYAADIYVCACLFVCTYVSVQEASGCL